MKTTISLLEQHIKKYIEKRRPPKEMRNQVDIAYTFDKNTLIINELHRTMDGSEPMIEHPVVKARYYKSQDIWKIYWMRASGAWEKYEPHPEAETIFEVLAVVGEDAYCCFFG